MHCENCPLASRDEACADFDEIGYELKDGAYGCRTPANKIKKISDEYGEYLGDMGTDMGQEMQAEYCKVSVEDIVKVCKHMVGLDYHKPYSRHGKAFYRPYRNYYADGAGGNKYLDAMLSHLIEKCVTERSTWYYLTTQGLAWLGRQINVHIYPETD